MENLISIPKSSIFFISIDQQPPSREIVEQHHSVLIVSLTNNQKILAGEDFDRKWVFQVDELTDDFLKGYLGKHLKLVEKKKVANYTGMVTSMEETCPWVLTCVLPTQIMHEQGDPIGKLVDIIMISAGFSLRKIPNFLNYETILKQIRAENSRFWREHCPDSTFITKAFCNRRFRNDDFSETDDYSAIQNMPIPQRIDGYTFLIDDDDNDYDESMSLSDNNNESINPSKKKKKKKKKDKMKMKTGMKMKMKKLFGANDGLDYKGKLRNAMGIQPLDPNDYESYLTQTEMEDLFRTIAIFENSQEMMIDLLEIFMKSFYCCHLIFRNSFIMRKFKNLITILDETDQERELVRIWRSLTWGLYTLYAEELLLGGNLNPSHRAVWNLECASYLPVHIGKNIYNSPYLCLPIHPKAMNLPSNLLGLPRFYPPSGYWRRDDQATLNFKRQGIREKGIHSINDVRTNIVVFTNGILEELNDPEIFLTGSGAEACLYNNPLFRRGNFTLDQIYPTRELGLKEGIATHQHSDIDLVVFTDDQSVLKKKMEKIKECLQLNLGDLVEVIKVNDHKYRFTSPKMKREIDLFMTFRNPAALLFNYHITTCRAAIPFGNSDVVSQGSILMTSMILSSHLGFCIDRRWFSSRTSLYDRICRQLSRGIGMLLNVAEIQMIRSYQHSSDKWKYMEDMIEISIVNNNNNNNNNNQNQNRSHVKTYLPYIDSPFFKKVQSNCIGPYFKGTNHVRNGGARSNNHSIGSKRESNFYQYQRDDPLRTRDQYGNFI